MVDGLIRSVAGPVLVAVLIPVQGPAGQAAACRAAPYDCAVADVERHQFASAIDTLEALLSETPQHLKAINLVGIALTGAGRIEEANDRFRQALALDASFYPALKNLAINQFNQGQLTEARRAFERVLASAPDDEVTHLHLAEIHARQERCPTALPHYEKAGARLAQQAAWLLRYATCLVDEGDLARAIATLDRLPADAAQERFEAGVLLGEAEAHADAARFFGSARDGYEDPDAAGYNHTLMLIEAGDHEGAIRVAEELLETRPKRAELYSLVARAYVGSQRVKEAYDALREATRLEPRTVEHYVDLAIICLDHENYDLGLEIVDVGLSYRPDSSLLYLQRGVVLAMKGLVEQAEQEFESAHRAAPDAAVPMVALAMAWMQTGRTDKAIELLRPRAKRGSKDAVLFYVLGIAVMRSGADPTGATGTEAADAFGTAVQLQPDFPEARVELGKLLLKRGDVTGAIAHLEKAVALDPDSATPAYILAQAYRKQGKTDRARELLARVTVLNARSRGDDPDGDLKRVVIRVVREGGRSDSDAAAVRHRPLTGASRETTAAPYADSREAKKHFDAGLALERSGQARQALEEYQQALRLAPDFVQARHGLSSAAAKIGDLDGAIKLLRQVTAEVPRLAVAHYDLGVNLWNRAKAADGRPGVAGEQDRAGEASPAQQLDEAVTALTRATELDGSEPRFHLALGQLLAERQRLVPAIDRLRRATALAPEDPECAYNLGLALRLHGDLDAAEAQFRAALKESPSHAMARRSLGLVLRQKGDLPAAATELRHAVEAQPGDAQGHHLLGTVLQKLDDVPGALDAYRQAIRLDPRLTEARVTLARLLARAGRKQEALAEQAEVERLNAEKAAFGRALVLLDSASSHLQSGRVSTAIDQFREAAALSPDFAEAHYRLGVALAQRPSDAAGAESALRRALALDPEHARAHYELGRLLATRGNTAAALVALHQATELAPGLIDAQKELARLSANAKDWPAAVVALNAVLAWDASPGSAETHYALAKALAAQGAGSEAARQLAIAQEIDSARRNR